MKINYLFKFTLVMVVALFLAAGCMKVVKEEETVGKSAQPAEQPKEEKPAAPKEEVAIAPKEEKVEAQPVQETPQPEVAAKEEKESSAKAEAGDEVSEAAAKKGMLLTVYFDFDRFTIRDDMKSTLEKDAEWLKKNQKVNIRVEGHCDERGTNEYNIALGERRAQSIKEYLINYGIAQSRLSTISYGEEKPVDLDHTEEAWTKNRRGELVIIKK